MDIDQAVKDALELAHEIQDSSGYGGTADPEELATLVIEIDNWIRKGGGLPAAWGVKL